MTVVRPPVSRRRDAVTDDARLFAWSPHRLAVFEHALEIGTREPFWTRHEVGSRRADHGRKQEPGDRHREVSEFVANETGRTKVPQAPELRERRIVSRPRSIERRSLTGNAPLRKRRSCATGATSRSRWPRLSFLVTCSPTSCAVSTGSDCRQPRHERWPPVPSGRRRQDRCARTGPDRRQKCHSGPPMPPLGPQSSGSARRWSSLEGELHVERFRVTLDGGRVPYGEFRFTVLVSQGLQSRFG